MSGPITVDANPVCVGNTITFTASGLVDNGGRKRTNCVEVDIPPVPKYEWTLSVPPGYPAPLPTLDGIGPVATVLAKVAGTYSVSFTGIGDRDCAPESLPPVLKTAEATQPDLSLAGVADEDEETLGGFLCVNDDDDNGDGTPDKDETGATVGEDDLVPLAVTADGTLVGTLTLDCVDTWTSIRLYNNTDRSSPVTLPASWELLGLPKTFSITLYVEGIAPSTMLRDIELKLTFTGDSGSCQDAMKLTVIRAEIDPVTSGTNPVPINPAIVAPVDVGLDDGTIFQEGNKFELTTIEPDIDLSSLPVDWGFVMTGGSINPDAILVVDSDRRGARLSFLPFSFGNFGTGRIIFAVQGDECKSMDTLVRNVQPDIESKDFRFKVKAHLTTDGQGNSTTRTVTEVQGMMTDVTKVLSQCGVIVTTSIIVTTVVPTAYLDLGTTFERGLLFDIDEDEFAIDMYFVQKIEGGIQAGDTLAPFPSLAIEAGIAIADVITPPAGADIPIEGQNLVRLVSHEITHYLLNHFSGDTDHQPDDENLMYFDTVDSKRDLDESQCLELRSNYGVD